MLIQNIGLLLYTVVQLKDAQSTFQTALLHQVISAIAAVKKVREGDEMREVLRDLLTGEI